MVLVEELPEAVATVSGTPAPVYNLTSFPIISEWVCGMLNHFDCREWHPGEREATGIAGAEY